MTKYRVYNKNGNIFVSQSELPSDFNLVIETEDDQVVMDNIVDFKGAVLMEDSVSDDIPYYNYRFELKDGNVEIVEDNNFEYGGWNE